MQQRAVDQVKSRLHWGLLLLILIALGLRLWDLNVLPPGLYYDEAFDGLDARRIAAGGFYPIYLPANNGREPLYMYLAALFIKLLGPTAYTLRLTSAVIGVLTVPAVYFAAQSILQDLSDRLLRTSHSRFLAAVPALVAAAGIAISFWHLGLSRLALRVVLLPLFSALAMGFFWRAWSRIRYRDFVWSGVSMALALYAYTAARLLPIVVALFVVIELGVDGWHSRADLKTLWKQWRGRVIGLGLMSLTSALLLAPLLLYFLENSAYFSARAADVSVFNLPQADMAGTPFERIVHNLLLVARSFYTTGDANPRQNLSGRPVNDPLQAVLFTLGWLACLVWIKQAWARLLLLWLAGMLLPTVLTALAPHALRASGALPPLALLYGVGAGVIVSWLLAISQRTRPDAKPLSQNTAHKAPATRWNIPVIAGAFLVAGMVAFSGLQTTFDYFRRWPEQSKLGQEFDVDRQLAAEYIVEHLNEPDDGPILVASDLFVQPQMAYALGQVHLQPWDGKEALHPSTDLPVRAVRKADFDSRQSMYLLSRSEDAVVVNWLEPVFDQSQAWAGLSSMQAESATLVQSPLHQPGWPQISLRPLPPGATLKPRQIRYPLDVRFANGMHLVGYDVEPDSSEPGAAGEPFRLTLFWKADAAPVEAGRSSLDPSTDRFDVFAHLVGEGAVWQTDNGPLEQRVPLDWAGWLDTDATIEDVRFLGAPATMKAGKAHFETGLYYYRPRVTEAEVDRIPILDGDNQPVSDNLALGPVLVGSGTPGADLSHLLPLDIEFDRQIKLSGWNTEFDLANSRRLIVDLGWTGSARMLSDYSAFVHLIDAEGQIVTQQDAPPGGTENTTRFWVPGETVRSTHVLELPEDIAISDLRLRIGLYEPVSGRQLSVTATSNASIAPVGSTYGLIPVSP